MHKYTKKLLLTACFIFSLTPYQSNAQDLPSQKSLIDQKVISDIKGFIDTDIVILSAQNQNKKYGQMTQEQIDALDKQWREETKIDNQPLISAILSNPLSSYLTRVQAQSTGLYSAIFVMDFNGLNVGQSAITSDFWQGDEDKFQKTYNVSADAVFIDEPEDNEDFGIKTSQVNMTLKDKEGNKIGSVTVDVNLNELQRRKALGLM